MIFKKSIPLLVMAASISALTGCTETKSMTSSEPSLLEVNVSPEDVVFDWQEPFQNVISSFKSSDKYTSDSRFELLDITGDSVPELIISPSQEVSAQCQVYTLIGPSAIQIAETGSYGAVQYIASENAIGYCYDGEGFSIGEYLTFQEGSFDKAFDFYNNAGKASSGAVIRYEVNGNDVTLAKYEEYLHPYRDFVTAIVGRKNTFGDESVDYALHRTECWDAVLTDNQKAIVKERLTSVIDTFDFFDAAFEIVDLDLNGVPEIVLSTGVLNDSEVRIFYFEEDGLKELDTSCNTDGSISFDMKAKIFYATDFDGNINCWSMAGADVSGFKPSDSIMSCGRKYEFTAENIGIIFG